VNKPLNQLKPQLRSAVCHFWNTRRDQNTKQTHAGTRDQGTRGAVTGGKQMDGFIKLTRDLVLKAGISDADIYRSKSIELPGYFRPTKQWDLLVVSSGTLLAVIELKSQVGPSFGNNFNNRAEEAIGSAADLWAAYREGAFKGSVRPWLGYVFLLEDCAKSRTPVKVDEPHFSVFPEFKGSSYLRRYEWLCRKLVLERYYEAAAFMTSPAQTGPDGDYTEPADDLTFHDFSASLYGEMTAHVTMGNNRR
jgi:hypothetical protein